MDQSIAKIPRLRVGLGKKRNFKTRKQGKAVIHSLTRRVVISNAPRGVRMDYSDRGDTIDSSSSKYNLRNWSAIEHRAGFLLFCWSFPSSSELISISA